MTSAPISEGAEVRLLARLEGEAFADEAVGVESAGRGALRKSSGQSQLRNQRQRMMLAKMVGKLTEAKASYPLPWHAGSLGRKSLEVPFLPSAWVVTGCGTLNRRAAHAKRGQCTPMRDTGLFGGRRARWRGLGAQNLQQIWVTKARDGGHGLILAFPFTLGAHLADAPLSCPLHLLIRRAPHAETCFSAMERQDRQATAQPEHGTNILQATHASHNSKLAPQKTLQSEA
ncbi:hypothetical protein PSPO01_01770 [Paraphaeosphaeria sporulosa]